MSRVTQKTSTKGSQYWLQEFVNHRQSTISRAISKELNLTDKIEWLSPLAADRYAEYRDESFLASLGIKANKEALEHFWPRAAHSGMASRSQGRRAS